MHKENLKDYDCDDDDHAGEDHKNYDDEDQI